ncbi:DUF502 domain-containing protein [Candidatus Marithrix sp. Canyon 246]|uniref:DUF502 domain-containing protein n=1 Tax=Candidatus Marithrix sp. Canyon 246 TaxID=1827136 RepID=UPI00084A1B86|nr:DUF502 domain-containing protein [Candidatus Marithrix sp. Canyon 246]
MESNKYSISRYMITGVFTVIPILVTWVIFQFLFNLLSQIGTPAIKILADIFPSLADWITNPWFLSIIGVLFTLVVLYLLGLIATFVIGKRIIEAFDYLINKLPVVKVIYGSIKKLVVTLQQKPTEAQRVVLIEFPSPAMKTVGLVTQVFTDHDTGEKLAAVYVPTTPNPTSGYLEIIPLDKLISTNWSLDEAMTFIMSGGAVAPDKINYSKSAKS